MICTHVSGLEAKYGKLEIEEIVVGVFEKWAKYDLPAMPTVKIGSRFLTREEYSSKQSFERILLEESGIAAPAPATD